VYWPELIRVCKERKTEWLDRFIKLGPRVGREEREWKEPTGSTVNGMSAAPTGETQQNEKVPDLHEGDGMMAQPQSVPAMHSRGTDTHVCASKSI
jgi:hypothetical protein